MDSLRKKLALIEQLLEISVAAKLMEQDGTDKRHSTDVSYDKLRCKYVG